MATSDEAKGSSTLLQSLERGLAVIRAFDAVEPELTLSEVARKTGLTPATARRVLLTLESLGYVGSSDRWFFLKPRLLELGYAYLASAQLPDIAMPHLEALVADVRESSSISVLDGTDIVYIARVPTRRIMTVNISVGTRLPAAATSMGRVLLANLPLDQRDLLLATKLVGYTDRTTTDPRQLSTILNAVEQQGWAIVDQELEIGLRAIASPIRDAQGRVIAAANISAAATRVTVRELQSRLLPKLLATVQSIAQDLKHVPRI